MSLCKCEPILKWMRNCDHILYQALVEILIPDVLRPVPSKLLAGGRSPPLAPCAFPVPQNEAQGRASSWLREARHPQATACLGLWRVRVRPRCAQCWGGEGGRPGDTPAGRRSPEGGAEVTGQTYPSLQVC